MFDDDDQNSFYDEDDVDNDAYLTSIIDDFANVLESVFCMMKLVLMQDLLSTV
jgi:hypothetical protein